MDYTIFFIVVKDWKIEVSVSGVLIKTTEYLLEVCVENEYALCGFERYIDRWKKKWCAK